MVGHKDVIGEKQNEVALIRRTFQVEFYRFELKGEIVAECAIQSEVMIFTALQLSDNRTQNGKDRRRTRPFFFVIDPVRRSDRQVKTAIGVIEGGQFRQVGNGRANELQNDLATGIQRRDLHRATTGFDHHRRFGKAKLPAGITPGIFVVRGEERASAAVQLFGQPVAVAMVVGGNFAAGDRHTAFGLVSQIGHIGSRVGYGRLNGRRIARSRRSAAIDAAPSPSDLIALPQNAGHGGSSLQRK